MYTNARAAYLGNSVSTASPGRLLVMLLERLELDVRRAIDALDAADVPEAHNQLVHAQDIVMELRTSLRLDVWDGAAQLARIYDWLHTELVRANTRKDAATARGCLPVVVDLASAWREAAVAAASGQSPVGS